MQYFKVVSESNSIKQGMPVYQNRIAAVKAQLAAGRYSEPYMHYHGKTPHQNALAFFGQAPTAVGHRLYDIGCGFGSTLRELMMNTNGIRFQSGVGVDLQPDIIDLAKELSTHNLSHRQADHQFIAGDITALRADAIKSVAKGNITCAISLNVFVHLTREQMVAALKIVKESMGDHGKLYIEDFYKKHDLSETQEAQLRDEVSSPYLPTMQEYLKIIREAFPGVIPVFSDISKEYTDYASTRHQKSQTQEGLDESSKKFRKTMNDLLVSGNVGGARIKVSF